MHSSGKGNKVASVLKHHGKMWYNFAVTHFDVPNFAPVKPPPPPGSMQNWVSINRSTWFMMQGIILLFAVTTTRHHHRRKTSKYILCNPAV